MRTDFTSFDKRHEKASYNFYYNRSRNYYVRHIKALGRTARMLL